MSLGGIAVAIGAMVDASIIMVENVHKRLEDWEAGRPPEPRERVIVRALQEVGRPIFFALLVITVSFLPIFTLEGDGGPALQAARVHEDLLDGLRGAARGDADAGARGAAHPRAGSAASSAAPGHRCADRAPTRRSCASSVRRRRWVVAAARCSLVLAHDPGFPALGSEFMPPLNEGTLLYMPTAPPGISDARGGARAPAHGPRAQAGSRRSRRVFGKIGRAETATDPAPLSMVETVITLKPERSGARA